MVFNSKSGVGTAILGAVWLAGAAGAAVAAEAPPAQDAPAAASTTPAGRAAATAPAAPAAQAGSAAEETGLAAVYSDKLNGHRTASGSRYDRNKLTAAHKTLPFGTKLKLTNEHNGKSVVVKITDRGPMQADRILDITPRAAHALGIGAHSMGKITAEVVN